MNSSYFVEFLDDLPCIGAHMSWCADLFESYIRDNVIGLDIKMDILPGIAWMLVIRDNDPVPFLLK
jgi:hypothetical protein